MPIDSMLNLAIAAARAAGDHAKNQLGKIPHELKAHDQLVTQADRTCQQMIIDQITSHFPDHGFIGEEGPDGEMLKIRPKNNADIWWIIDPIDGTRNFAHHIPIFAVSLAAMQNGMPILGIIYDPNTNMLFSAADNQQAICNGNILAPCINDFHSNSQFAVSGNYPDHIPQGIIRLMNHYVCSNLGSAALHYAYTAAGGFAASYSNKVKLWDIAAGAAINQSVGADVYDLNGRPRFPFSCDNYNGETLPSIVILKKHLPQFIQIMNPNDR